jgi:hypothetical protein
MGVSMKHCRSSAVLERIEPPLLGSNRAKCSILKREANRVPRVRWLARNTAGLNRTVRCA